jgi:hypothetical protein
MARSMNATQCPRQYPHEKRSPNQLFLLFSHSLKGLKIFVSVIVNDTDAVNRERRRTVSILKRFGDHGQQPEEQRATGRSMNFFCQMLGIVFISIGFEK